MATSVNSLAYFGNMPMISGSCSIRAVYGAVGTVFALFHASISKSLFEPFHNVDLLAQKFPDRVTKMLDTVEISGPVLITNDSGQAAIVPLAVGALIGTATYFATSYLVARVASVVSSYLKSDPSNEKPSELQKKLVTYISYATTAAAFAIVAAFFFRRIPTEPGIHLLDWSFKKIN